MENPIKGQIGQPAACMMDHTGNFSPDLELGIWPDYDQCDSVAASGAVHGLAAVLRWMKLPPFSVDNFVGKLVYGAEIALNPSFKVLCLFFTQ